MLPTSMPVTWLPEVNDRSAKEGFLRRAASPRSRHFSSEPGGEAGAGEERPGLAARDSVEWAEPGREDWRRVWLGRGEGGGGPHTGANSTFAVLRALAGVVYSAGLNSRPRASFSLSSWERTSGLDATR